MSHNRNQLDFVKGDLVYFVGYEASTDRSRLGVVINVKVGGSHFPMYVIHWFKDNLQSTHTATHIDLAYTIGTADMIGNEISAKSLHHLKDRVNDRSEGD
jgi:hypothetical protein